MRHHDYDAKTRWPGQDPAVKSLLDNQAMQVVGDTPEQFAAFLRKEAATWKAVAAMANVSVE